MKKIVLLAGMFTGMVAVSFAQTTVGIKAGLNISNVNYSAGDFDLGSDTKFKSRIGGQLGFVVNSQVAESFAIRPELLLTSKGTTQEFTDKSTLSLTTGYLEIPVNFVYGIPVGQSLKVDVFAGPYVAFGLGGYYRNEDSNGDLDSDGNIRFKPRPDEPKEDETYLNGLDAGFNFGVGVHLGGLIISYNYGLGLSNIYPNLETEWDGYDRSKIDKYSNRVSTIGVTYLFGN